MSDSLIGFPGMWWTSTGSGLDETGVHVTSDMWCGQNQGTGGHVTPGILYVIEYVVSTNASLAITTTVNEFKDPRFETITQADALPKLELPSGLSRKSVFQALTLNGATTGVNVTLHTESTDSQIHDILVYMGILVNGEVRPLQVYHNDFVKLVTGLEVMT